MIINLTKEERQTLSALDPEGSGSRAWMSAREIASAAFRKKEENLKQGDVRKIRNAFRKLLREDIVEVSPGERGQYRISNRGRKIVASGENSFDSIHERGEATKSVQKAPKKPKAAKKSAKKAPKKPPTKKSKAAPKEAAPKKAAPKKPPTKKAAPKKAAPKKGAMAPPKRPKATRDNAKAAKAAKTDDAVKGAEAAPSNGASKRPSFKRKNAPPAFEASTN